MQEASMDGFFKKIFALKKYSFKKQNHRLQSYVLM